MDVDGHDYYTYTRFDDLSIVDYTMVYEYMDGNILTKARNRDKHSRNNGKYFYEIPEITGEFPLKSISLMLPNFSEGNISTMICKKP